MIKIKLMIMSITQPKIKNINFSKKLFTSDSSSQKKINHEKYLQILLDKKIPVTNPNDYKEVWIKYERYITRFNITLSKEFLVEVMMTPDDQIEEKSETQIGDIIKENAYDLDQDSLVLNCLEDILKLRGNLIPERVPQGLKVAEILFRRARKSKLFYEHNYAYKHYIIGQGLFISGADYYDIYSMFNNRKYSHLLPKITEFELSEDLLQLSLEYYINILVIPIDRVGNVDLSEIEENSDIFMQSVLSYIGPQRLKQIIRTGDEDFMDFLWRKVYIENTSNSRLNVLNEKFFKSRGY